MFYTTTYELFGHGDYKIEISKDEKLTMHKFGPFIPQLLRDPHPHLPKLSIGPEFQCPLNKKYCFILLQIPSQALFLFHESS